MADLKSIGDWAKRKAAGSNVPGMDGNFDVRVGDPAPGDDSEGGEGGEGGGEEHSLFADCAATLREKANEIRQMEDIEGVDLDDLAQKAEALADELEDADAKAEEAEQAKADEEEPDGDEGGEDVSFDEEVPV